MRRLRQGILGFLALGLAVLALANRAPVDLFLWPEALGEWIGPPPRLHLPLFLVLFLGLLLGALIGMLLEWRRERQLRQKAAPGRAGAAALSPLEAEVAALLTPPGESRRN